MSWGFWLRGTWDLSPLTRDLNLYRCIGRQSLTHWTTREVLKSLLFKVTPLCTVCWGQPKSVQEDRDNSGRSHISMTCYNDQCYNDHVRMKSQGVMASRKSPEITVPAQKFLSQSVVVV